MEEKPGRGDHLKSHQFPKGVSGNVKGKPPGTISRKTILRAVLDIKLKATDPVIRELAEKYPLLFSGKQKYYIVEEVITMIVLARAMTVDDADGVRQDVLNRIHGKPLQAVMTMAHDTPIEESMTTDQTREALDRVRATLEQFEKSKALKDQGARNDDQDGD